MCEFLIQVTERNDPRLLTAGQVISVCPDNWKWSVYERQHPQWRIIKCPDMRYEEAIRYQIPAQRLPGLPSRRLLTLDLLALPRGDTVAAETIRRATFQYTGPDPRVIG